MPNTWQTGFHQFRRLYQVQWRKWLARMLPLSALTQISFKIPFGFGNQHSTASRLMLDPSPNPPIDLIVIFLQLPKPQDKNWLDRICNEHLGRSHAFIQPKIWAQERFGVQHFSETVEYTINGFVEKNLDRVIPEHADILNYSEASYPLSWTLSSLKNVDKYLQMLFGKPTIWT